MAHLYQQILHSSFTCVKHHRLLFFYVVGVFREFCCLGFTERGLSVMVLIFFF